MNSREIILAFLAMRYPAMFDGQTIAARVNASGMMDDKLSLDAANTALSELARMGCADVTVDKISGRSCWGATIEGKRQWVLSGQLAVG
jgi:hypothetical protein